MDNLKKTKKTKKTKIIIPNSQLTGREAMLKERIDKVKKEALKRIRLDIEEHQKRIPTNEEVLSIYEKRLKEYEKSLANTNKRVAIGGPAVGGQKK